MNDYPSDAQTKALEFVNTGSTYVLIATIALTAWVASGNSASRSCNSRSRVSFGAAVLSTFTIALPPRVPFRISPAAG